MIDYENVVAGPTSRWWHIPKEGLTMECGTVLDEIAMTAALAAASVVCERCKRAITTEGTE